MATPPPMPTPPPALPAQLAEACRPVVPRLADWLTVAEMVACVLTPFQPAQPVSPVRRGLR